MSSLPAPVHLPGLNGLRAIAALSVVLAHTLRPIAGSNGLPVKFDLPMAQYSVTLFFVISGFLITYLLLLEREQGGISVRNFYMRRILRIWPIYYLFLAVCLIIGACFHSFDGLFSGTLWWYIFFAANIPFISAQGIPILAHYWSIGSEEQYYLFWPWVVRTSGKRILIVASAILVTLFTLKATLWLTVGHGNFLYRLLGITQFHCMMLGAIGAVAFKAQSPIIKKVILNRAVQTAAWSLFILLGLGVFSLPAPVALETLSLIALVMILGQVSESKKLFSLDTRIFDFLGKISYGIYILHPLVVFFIAPLVCLPILPAPVMYLVTCMSVLIVTVFLAWLSYTRFERPFLHLKRRFSTVQSSDTRS